jgi:chromosome segregation protein
MVTGQQDFQRLEQKFTLVGRRRGEVAAEVSELAVASDETERVHQQTLATLAQAHASEEAARVAVAETEQRAQDSRERFAAQQLVFTERKVQLASVSERASACRETRERALREHRDVSQRIDALEADRHTSAEEAGRVAAEIFAAKVALAEARVRAREAQAAFENARLGLDDARHTLGLREAELREMRAVLQELQTRLGEQQVRLSKLQLEREHLEQAIRERFRGLELVKVVGDYHARDMITREHKRRMQELTDTIDRMGAVNLDAMKEYEEQAERFDYYTNHKNDLEAALADLDKAIAQMNKESKRLFQHAFEGINRRFKEIFPKMFRGGKAELRLTNPDDMLETGIDILAQPPGKRLGNIELMSGGEKAFTAVSLLLSIFRFKPSPFCILDEVDAPLDDANIDRYVEGIRAMTDRSQFIVITHSKRTMQAVDVLYGVTMQEPGVSKLVGVRVGDAATRSAKRRLTTVAPAAPAAEILEAPTAVA